MSFEIETNIPLPRRKENPSAAQYPFHAMSVGHSFLVPCADADVKKFQARLCQGACVFRKKNPALKDWKFWTRPETGGVRIWRAK
jgi:hypothetical protein